jgi:5'-deoxynucleotidase YfbR-like HD superfamily hydrolase
MKLPSPPPVEPYVIKSRGDFTTYTGKKLNILYPDPKLIDIEDIAVQLSRIPRFNGATKRTYTVAQHSVFVATIIHPAYTLQGLLHDATEAYLGDIISPLKYELPSYLRIELVWELVIREKFNLFVNSPLDLQKEIKKADEIAALLEYRDLMKKPSAFLFTKEQEEIISKYKNRHITPQSEKKCYDSFMLLYSTLTKR